MKKKISITLSSNVLARVDQLAGSKRSRSVSLSERFGMSCDSRIDQETMPLIWR